jgi:hypothetical protein
MPDDFGDLAVNTRVHFLRPHAHTRLRVRLAPGIPHALFSERAENCWQTSRETSGEIAKLCRQTTLFEN